MGRFLSGRLEQYSERIYTGMTSARGLYLLSRRKKQPHLLTRSIQLVCNEISQARVSGRWAYQCKHSWTVGCCLWPIGTQTYKHQCSLFFWIDIYLEIFPLGFFPILLTKEGADDIWEHVISLSFFCLTFVIQSFMFERARKMHAIVCSTSVNY